MNNEISTPVIHRVDGEDRNKRLEKSIEFQENSEYLLEYPTVYIHTWVNKKENHTYVGEANNVVNRTKQHFDNNTNEASWQINLTNTDGQLYIIGHEHFNKSLTLDIEDRLINYLLASDGIKKIHNKRSNPQGKYYPQHESNIIFRKIWRKLGEYNKDIFPSQKLIEDSAIFKASPLHKLTKEQSAIKAKIMERLGEMLSNGETGQIIFVSGGAGTGKTVLNSTLFNEICNKIGMSGEKINCNLLVNHEQLLIVYKQIAQKLNLGDKVHKPTSFINKGNQNVDVVLIDEAHLLLTRGKQSYTGKNQLDDIRKLAKIVIVMFDEKQILKTEQIIEEELLINIEKEAKLTNSYYKLEKQLRISANDEINHWIHMFTKEHTIEKIPTDKNYDITIFEKPEELEKAIYKKSNEGNELSRIIATFDWEYSGNKRPKERMQKYWEVCIGNWKKPWNLELQRDFSRSDKKNIDSVAWAEQPHTIGEIGSTFTIQGFDLNYAGVILGPSVQYKDGAIVYNPTNSKNKNATANRTLADGSKRKFGEELIANEVNVLMSRGVKGLYIYACDAELRQALIEASQ